MIRAIVGGVGSGKTVYAVKRAIGRDRPCYTNFALKSKKAMRLKMEHVAQKTDKGSWRVNWEYWAEARMSGEFDIYLDEAHNLLHSRQGMRGRNVALTNWIAQIRKVLGESEESDLVFVTQRLARLDVAARDLLHSITHCTKKQTDMLIETRVRESGKAKKKMIPKTLIMLHHFVGANCVEKYNAYIETGRATHDMKSYFLANPFFQYYDSYDLIPFGDDWEGYL